MARNGEMKFVRKMWIGNEEVENFAGLSTAGWRQVFFKGIGLGFELGSLEAT